MTAEVRLVQAGMAMQRATISSWFKQPGDTVSAGESIGEAEAEKTVVEIIATASGTLSEIVVPVGVEVPVRTVLALIADEQGASTSGAGGAGASAARSGFDFPPSAPAPAAAGADRAGSVALSTRTRVQVTPVARRLAKDNGVLLDTVRGSGPNGRIVADDVRAALAPSPAPVERVDERPSPAPVSSPTPVERVDERPSSPAVSTSAPSGRPLVSMSLGVDVTELLHVLDERGGGAIQLDAVTIAAAAALQSDPDVVGVVSDRRTGGASSFDVAVTVFDGGDVHRYVVADAGNLRLRGVVAAREHGAAEPATTPPPVSIVGVMSGPIEALTPRLGPSEAIALSVGAVTERLTRRGDDAFAWRTFTQLSVTIDADRLPEQAAVAFVGRLAQSLAAPDSLFV